MNLDDTNPVGTPGNDDAGVTPEPTPSPEMPEVTPEGEAPVEGGEEASTDM